MRGVGVDRLVTRDAALGDDLVAVIAKLALRQPRTDLDRDIHVVRELREDVDRVAACDGHHAHDVRRAEKRREVELLREHRLEVRALRTEAGEPERRDAFERPVLGHLLQLDDLALHPARNERSRVNIAMSVFNRDLALRRAVFFAQKVEPLVHLLEVHITPFRNKSP